MGIRAILTRAAGAFVITTVLFAAAMVLAHGLAIPNPVGRMLPPTRADAPVGDDGVAGDQVTEGLALTVDRQLRPSQLDDEPVAEVTAVPIEPDASGTGRAGPDADGVALDDPPGDAAGGDGGSNAGGGDDKADAAGGDPPETDDGAPGAAQRHSAAPDAEQPVTAPVTQSPSPDGGQPATTPSTEPTDPPAARIAAPSAPSEAPIPGPPELAPEPDTPTTQAAVTEPDPAAEPSSDNDEGHWWDFLIPNSD